MADDRRVRILVIEAWIFLLPVSILYLIGFFWLLGSPELLANLEFTSTIIIHGLALISGWRLVIEFICEGGFGLRRINEIWYLFPLIDLLLILTSIIYLLIASIFGVSIPNDSTSIMINVFSMLISTAMVGVPVAVPFAHIMYETYHEYH